MLLAGDESTDHSDVAELYMYNSATFLSSAALFDMMLFHVSAGTPRSNSCIHHVSLDLYQLHLC